MGGMGGWKHIGWKIVGNRSERMFGVLKYSKWLVGKRWNGVGRPKTAVGKRWKANTAVDRGRLTAREPGLDDPSVVTGNPR